jgi:hypothetical protein
MCDDIEARGCEKKLGAVCLVWVLGGVGACVCGVSRVSCVSVHWVFAGEGALPACVLSATIVGMSDPEDIFARLQAKQAELERSARPSSHTRSHFYP